MVLEVSVQKLIYCNCRANNYGCSGGYSSYYINDYYAGAQKACKTLLGSSWGLAPIGVESIRGTTSSGNNLNAYCNKYRSTLGININADLWTSTPHPDGGNIMWYVYFGGCKSNTSYRRNGGSQALCLYNP